MLGGQQQQRKAKDETDDDVNDDDVLCVDPRERAPYRVLLDTTRFD